MPNYSPPVRRPAPREPEPLPRGMTRHKATGLIAYRWTVDGVRSKPVYGTTPAECYGKRAELEAAAIAPPAIVPLPSDVTLAEYLRDWSEHVDVRPRSRQQHADAVRLYLVPMFGEDLRLDKLDRETIRRAFDGLRERPGARGRPLAPRTVQLVFASLRTALYQAVEDHRLAANPAARLNPNGTSGKRSRARRVGTELRIPSDAELRAVLDVIPEDDVLRPLVVLSTLTGLRQSEALGLRRQPEADVDVDLRLVHVWRVLERTTREIDDPKSATSDRYVPFDPMLVDVIRHHRAVSAAARLRAGDAWHESDFEFVELDRVTLGRKPRPAGSPLVGSTVSKRLAAAIERAGVDHFTWHALRHKYASGCLARHVPVEIVSKRLGHHDVSITIGTYHHFIPHHDDAGIAAAAAAMLRS